MGACSTEQPTFRLALVQMRITADKAENIVHACSKIAEAARAGANVIVLPECFNSPYGTQYFEAYAEPVPGPTTAALAAAAKEHGVYLIGGSIPERDGDKLYNTCTCYGRNGQLVVTHRKIHLFDMDIPGKVTFRESDVLSAGDRATVFETEYCKIGIGICMDLRFPDYAEMLADTLGCSMLVYPGAWTMTNGPRHWEMLLKARANDGQVFVAGACCARDEAASFVAWGHSTIVNPWADVVSTTGHDEDIVYGTVDLKLVDEVRGVLPVRSMRRRDVYRQCCQSISKS